ncbi:DUF1127 domain-containing protein [Pseudomonas orientalis]|uniref:Uncharacterized conserved protein YjiS, DUF1127 family n=1 Tax=Pseudomonas orientalis TaxID=76758 RepID=A0A1H2I4J4_9PSED|nr:DUF1127 domain-containing protein [Pseudomonas orientalis]KRP65883.1 hypothetical protein TU82_08955 [Pseudomonas orientalis]SDU39050.1 Uncharacterized conserved protein YjiS, DUF1127 family [Pseudomonas orientalis]
MKGHKDHGLMARSQFFGLLHTFSRWQALHRERRMLAGMSDDALKDIGLNRVDVEQEIHRHFWEDPLRK